MQLSLVSDGVYLTQKDGCFLLKMGEKKKKIAPKKITVILVCNRVFLSSQALVLAVENNVDVVFLNKYGDPTGRLSYGRNGRSVRLQMQQLHFSGTQIGLGWAKEWLQLKLKSQERFLKKLQANRSLNTIPFEESLERIQYSLGLIPLVDGSVEEQRPLLMGLEGNAAHAYFRVLSSLLPSKYRFARRSRRPAEDCFNAMLNYSLGVLYSIVERSCVLAGLNPYVGFLHAEHPYRPALVCDLIEPCRIWAEQVVTFLFTGRKVQESFFEQREEGVFLNKQGKEILLPALREFLDEKVHYNGLLVQRESICLRRAHELGNLLLEENPTTSEIIEF